MKSIVYKSAQDVAAEDRAVPELAADEVLIKVAYAGICGSDMFIYQGTHPRAKAPLIMGHEFSGVIEKGHPTLAKGTPVTVYPLLSCGECEPCKSGNPHVCNTLKLIGIDCDGGMAEYVKVPADKVVEIPAGLSLKLGAFIEPVAVGVHAVRRSGYKPGDTAVVYGAGPIGLCVASCLKYFGARSVIVVEANPYRLEIAKKLGFITIDAANDDVVASVKAATQGLCADFAFDCAAHPSVQATLMDVIKVRGTAVVVGSYKKPPEVDLLKIEFKELTMIGIRVYERRDFEIAAGILGSGTIDFELMLFVSTPEQAPAVFQDLLKGANAIKMLFKL
ncbi:zinc-dependent alcohol dehydrogenase [Propionivibrio dicarboxylicus]|uniref:2-desacetyl-2-hydroxyethyl bacteriochlorophyllide A dehydrogenase n=1 Tax=Propionivibrio dicarboxylicus TaxID=83767 RepID=A0A1G8DS93_9RHOO|nr:alcohol dehydrogenase catalytic domain-containing protein [Propionivibrio dicarboxylicus]SDH60557.1 2-desacetyl-2-hydroxyethyl bacteriochlorophyllide A dehydrogenase [Propionivibrio dicarboxylicus]